MTSIVKNSSKSAWNGMFQKVGHDIDLSDLLFGRKRFECSTYCMQKMERQHPFGFVERALHRRMAQRPSRHCRWLR